MGIKSKQPRFLPEKSKADDFFSTMFSWIHEAEQQEPKYSADSRARDSWLREFLPKEPNLMGIIKSTVDIDKNRGWKLVGGRNQVSRYTKILHSFKAAPGIYGWRPAISMASSSFWVSNMGAIVEIGRAGRRGPLRAMYTVDPARCRLTGDDNKPLNYYPTKRGTMQKWNEEDFFRVSSLPSTDELFHGLGYCGVDRSVELAKLMIAVYDHDREQLGSKAPRGLMLLKGITQRNWQTAMQAREAKQEARGFDYFGPLAVIASANTSADAKMIALSQLPVSFNLREWMDMLIFGYAVCLGYDASEFWPVQFGALGRGTETEIQHEKATGKGRLDFVLGFQEQLQRPDIWPESLEFQFDQRDEKGDLIHAQVNQAWASVCKTLEGVLSDSERRVLLADWGVIPRIWAPTDSAEATDLRDENDDDHEIVEDEEEEAEEEEENGEEVGDEEAQSLRAFGITKRDAPKIPIPDTLVTKNETILMRNYKEELRSRYPIFEAARKFPDEPIVMYGWPANTITILWESGRDLLKPHQWSGF